MLPCFDLLGCSWSTLCIHTLFSVSPLVFLTENMDVRESDMFCRTVGPAHVGSLCIIAHFFTQLKLCGTTAGEFSGKMGLADSRVQCLVWVLQKNDERKISFFR